MSKDIFDKLVDPNKRIRLLFTIETDLNNCGENWPSQDDEVWEKVKAAKDDKDQIADDRERFELRMVSYEQILRDRYLNLDQTVARLNQTGSALLAALG